MMPQIKAEFKKLFTVRSTYIISLIFFLLSAFFAFYVQGFKNSASQNIPKGTAPLFIGGTITQVSNVIAVAGALIALFLMAHEYRYGTIIYTLTSSNSRSKVLASKIIAILAYVLVFSVISTAIMLGLVWAGIAASGHHLPAQDISYITYITKSVFLCEAYALAGLLFITIIRNQIGALAAFLIIPNTLEGLLSLLFKKDSVYMPFTALQQVVQAPALVGAKGAHRLRDAASTGSLTPPHGALVFLAYLIGGYIIAWYLFLKRDAS